MIYFLKYTGITLISITCICVGISKAYTITEKLIFLETVKTAIITIKQRLIFTLATPEELFKALMDNNRFNKFEFFKDTEHFITNDGFETGWRQAVENINFLNNTEKNIIISLADTLGKSDLETQIKQLDLIIDQLDSTILNQKSNSESSKRVYTMLGVLSSLALTVLFL